MLWACILLPHLALDGVLRRRPADDATPLVLATGPAQSRTVYAANPAARAAGLHPGQRLAAAQALLASFEIVDYDARTVERWQRFLAAWAYRYSGQVSLLPHAVVLEIGKSLGLFGPWPRFERTLRQDLAALGFRHQIAVAPTAYAACVLAGVRDGVAVTDPVGLRAALGGVSVHQARLPGSTAEALATMGIRRMSQLLALPRDGLRRRFGRELPDYLDGLLGQRPEVLPLFHPPDVFDARIELSYEVDQVQPLLFPLRRLTGDLAAYLSGRDGGVQRFQVRLEHDHGPATKITVGLLAPQRDPAMLFETARARLERTSIAHPVVMLGLLASELPAFVPSGRDLFDERPAHAMPIAQLRERLRARLGDGAVYRLQPSVDPRPECAQGKIGAVADHGVPEPVLRPTWLLERPVPLRGPVPRILAGPERLETGWWDGGDIRRDYYVVETSQGQRAWVFCPPGEVGAWMLHGWFA